MRNILQRQGKRAQGMTEYIIIVGLIAIVLITAVKNFGGEVNKGFQGSTKQIQDNVITGINGANAGGGGGGGNPGGGGGAANPGG